MSYSCFYPGNLWQCQLLGRGLKRVISRGLNVQHASPSHPGSSGWKPAKNNFHTHCRVLDQANRSRFLIFQYSAINIFEKWVKFLRNISGKYFQWQVAFRTDWSKSFQIIGVISIRKNHSSGGGGTHKEWAWEPKFIDFF